MVKCRSVTMDDRVAEMLTWFDGDAKDFPDFGALCFEELDTISNFVGPLHSRVSSIAFIQTRVQHLLLENMKHVLHLASVKKERTM